MVETPTLHHLQEVAVGPAEIWQAHLNHANERQEFVGSAYIGLSCHGSI
jgi:hypothetical protein